ncbi:MAG: hypothetical protein ACRDJU_06590 [Actinomycetota bacterium]
MIDDCGVSGSSGEEPGRAKERRHLLGWVVDKLPEVRRSVYGQRFL